VYQRRVKSAVCSIVVHADEFSRCWKFIDDDAGVLGLPRNEGVAQAESVLAVSLGVANKIGDLDKYAGTHRVSNYIKSQITRRNIRTT
jgi:hypothetical protein